MRISKLTKFTVVRGFDGLMVKTIRCPKCGAEMIRRENERRGAHKYWYECRNYPKCKGVLNRVYDTGARKYILREPIRNIVWDNWTENDWDDDFGYFGACLEDTF